MNDLKPLIPYEVVQPTPDRPFITEMLRKEWADAHAYYKAVSCYIKGTAFLSPKGRVYIIDPELHGQVQEMEEKLKPHRRNAWQSPPAIPRSVY